MDLQGALKETPSTGIMVGRRGTSQENLSPCTHFGNKLKLHTLMLDH